MEAAKFQNLRKKYLKQIERGKFDKVAFVQETSDIVDVVNLNKLKVSIYCQNYF